MNNIEDKTRKTACAVLLKELEKRYGPALAQSIIDEIRRAEAPDAVPDYLPVKAVSEMLYLFRKEARDAVRRLKQVRYEAEHYDVINIRTGRLRQEVERRYGLYFEAQRCFYRMVRKAMAAYADDPVQKGYRKSYRIPEQARAA